MCHVSQKKKSVDAYLDAGIRFSHFASVNMDVIFQTAVNIYLDADVGLLHILHVSLHLRVVCSFFFLSTIHQAPFLLANDSSPV